MPSITFSVKLDLERDAELVAWLQEPTVNRSYEIKVALYHYRNLPPPPPDSSSTPAPFDPSALVDALRLAAPELGKQIGKAVVKELQGTERPSPKPQR